MEVMLKLTIQDKSSEIKYKIAERLTDSKLVCGGHWEAEGPRVRCVCGWMGSIPNEVSMMTLRWLSVLSGWGLLCISLLLRLVLLSRVLYFHLSL